jgi:LEA14-like dessication related protein
MVKQFFNYSVLLLLASFLMAGSCLEIKDPEFLKMKDWQVQKVSPGYFQVTSKAQFYNPNSVGVTLTNVYVDVYLNEEKLGTINQISSIKVPKHSAFEVPLLLTFTTDGKLNLIFGNMLKLFSAKSTVINYKGFIQVKKAGIQLKIDLVDKYEFNLKDINIFK